jgi:cytoskeletal protein CcmA (bactofilin family)
MRVWLGRDKSARKELSTDDSPRKEKLNVDERGGFLDRGFKLEGKLEVEGTVRIDGEVTGTVRFKDRLILGEDAGIEGEIECAFLSVAGRVKGNIYCSSCLEILRSGVVEGEVHTPCLVIEEGGVLEGQCHMRAEDKVASVVPGLATPLSEIGLGSPERNSLEIN